MVTTGPNREEMDAQREVHRRSLAFYFSTPPYWPTLELFGWDDLGPRLRQLTREDRWDEMAELISDEVVDTLVPQGSYGEIADVLKEWYGGVAHGISFPLPEERTNDGQIERVLTDLRS